MKLFEAISRVFGGGKGGEESEDEETRLEGSEQGVVSQVDDTTQPLDSAGHLPQSIISGTLADSRVLGGGRDGEESGDEGTRVEGLEQSVASPVDDTTQPLDSAGHVSQSGVSGTLAESPEVSSPSAEEPLPGRTDQQAPWEPGKVFLGRYKVEQQLGQGGMGEVWLVCDLQSGDRFAVKRVLPELLQRGRGKILFLRELRTWINLPQHPNLTPCRFFQTQDDQLNVFADYVKGGSLQEWLGTDRLASLETILDVAIQFAWGLEVAHGQGLVHQDVKPLNVLMTADGMPRVTDFGLAKARAVIEAEEASGLAAEVTGAAGTPAYCSPEQSRSERLSNKTDVWSWGLSVLAMFTGARTWRSGTGADQVLTGLLKRHRKGEEDAFSVVPPESVVAVLQRCFQGDPAARWDRVSDAADALMAAYNAELGRPYPCRHPEVSSTVAPAHDRQVAGGVNWDDPRVWLRKALEADGRDPAEANRLIQRTAGSRQAQAIDDLIAYEEALTIYSCLVAAGRNDLEPDLATVCSHKAFVHGSAGDASGKVAMYDRAIEILERLVDQEGRRELANELALTCMNKANAVADLGDNQAAVDLYDRAIEIRERLVTQEGRPELANDLAATYQNKALAVHALGQNQAAVDLYDRAIEILERLVNQEGRRELANDLAATYHNKANVVADLGKNPAAVDLYDRAIEIRERLVNQEERPELANDLAATYNDKAAAVRALDDHQGAVELCDRAIKIREHLVNQEGRWELANDLAGIYQHKAIAVRALGNNQAAVELYDQAIKILERLVNQEGRWELANDLAGIYQNKAVAVNALDDHPAAVELYDRAIEIRERLVNEEGRRELADGLAAIYMNKGNAVSALDDHPAAVELYDKAIEILERLVNEEGRRELANELARTYHNKANAVRALGNDQAAAKLYDRAIEIRERLVNQEGRRELAKELADAYLHKVTAARALGDKRAEVELYDRVIEIRERLVNQEGRPELANDLARTYQNKATAVADLGDNLAAAELYDPAIKIRERLVNQEGRRELANDLAGTYMKKANVVADLGKNPAAVELYDRAIEIYERLVNQEGRRELANDLAVTYMNKATALTALGDNQAVVKVVDRAIEIYERLVNQEGRRELAGDLARMRLYWAIAAEKIDRREEAQRVAREVVETLEAEVNRTGRADLRGLVDLARKTLADLASDALVDSRVLGGGRDGEAPGDEGTRLEGIEIPEHLADQKGRRELANELAASYENKAMAASARGDNLAAVGLYDRAIEIVERLVNEEGRRELADDLAGIYQNKAMALGDERAAMDLYDRAIEILERLVNDEGRRELAHQLAMTYMNKAIAVEDLGNSRAAVELHDRAIEILERLVKREGRRELADDLAMIYVNKASALIALGDAQGAVEMYDQAIEIRERLVNEEGRRELAGNLARLKLARADAARSIGRRDEARRVSCEAIETLEAELNRKYVEDFTHATAQSDAAVEPAGELDERITVDLDGGVTMDFVLIQPGSFMMGSDKGWPHERPVHRVTITRPFYVGVCQVTHEQWQAIMGPHARRMTSLAHPVEQVSWEDCQRFLARLRKKHPQLDSRLPTEAQWEYACRAGSSTKYCFGDDPSGLSEYAWYDESMTQPVGQKRPNAWGLHDMHGNVWEWCADWSGPYPPGDVVDPKGPISGSKRVIRGGGWTNDNGLNLRSASRTGQEPSEWGTHLGFRVACGGKPGVAEGGETRLKGAERGALSQVDDNTPKSNMAALEQQPASHVSQSGVSDTLDDSRASGGGRDGKETVAKEKKENSANQKSTTLAAKETQYEPGTYSPSLVMPLHVGNSWTYSWVRPDTTPHSEPPNGDKPIVHCIQYYISDHPEDRSPSVTAGIATWKEHNETYTIIAKEDDTFVFSITAEPEGADREIRDGRYESFTRLSWRWREQRDLTGHYMALEEHITRKWGRWGSFSGPPGHAGTKLLSKGTPSDSRDSLRFEFHDGKWGASEVVGLSYGNYRVEYRVPVNSARANAFKGTEIVVPAGKFLGCLETIEGIYKGSEEDSPLICQTHSFWAPGIGKVREYQKAADGNITYELNLLRYELKPQE